MNFVFFRHPGHPRDTRFVGIMRRLSGTRANSSNARATHPLDIRRLRHRTRVRHSGGPNLHATNGRFGAALSAIGVPL
ncbi:hypothetical protein, partial [Burkholderia ubonensis]|uniref:hypothetical protein n=1 Tax=Burkholderia ubonensis TaxID=101571 RepID=UPI001E2C510F